MRKEKKEIKSKYFQPAFPFIWLKKSHDYVRKGWSRYL